jgi:hypothetical protein
MPHILSSGFQAPACPIALPTWIDSGHGIASNFILEWFEKSHGYSPWLLKKNSREFTAL